MRTKHESEVVGVTGWQILKPKLHTMYYILCDAEVMFYGTKNECLKYYHSMPNPTPMKLIRVASEKELRK